MSDEKKVITVLLPIEVIAGDYCWDYDSGDSSCDHFNNEGGHSICDLDFRYLNDSVRVLKPDACKLLKVQEFYTSEELIVLFNNMLDDYKAMLAKGLEFDTIYTKRSIKELVEEIEGKLILTLEKVHLQWLKKQKDYNNG